MRFLVDQDVYAVTVIFLRSLGHDVISAAQVGLAQGEDSKLLREAHDQNRILISRDRDFGALVFVQGSGPGVIYLRMCPSTLNAVHVELERVGGQTSHTKVRLWLWTIVLNAMPVGPPIRQFGRPTIIARSCDLPPRAAIV